MAWKHASSDTPKKLKVTPSAGKVRATVFCSCKGVMMTDYLSKGSTVTGAYYATTKLHEASKSNRRGKLRCGVLLLHGNAPAHTSAVATSAAAECGCELVPHPPHLPDLAPSDFCLFPLLIKDFSGTHFSNDNDVIVSVEVFFRGKINSSTSLVYRSCRNDGTSALKFAAIMWKINLSVVMLCSFIYEAGNFWNNTRTL